MNNLVSPEYLAQLEAHAALHPEWGSDSASMLSIQTLWDAVKESERVLDYGCGTGSLVQAINGHHVRGRWKARAMGYDPRNPSRWPHPHESSRGCWDLVTCTDVLEHVEEDKVPAVLADIASLMHRDGCAFLAVATGPAIAVLPKTDALPERNAHITQHDHVWWHGMCQESGLEADGGVTVTEHGFYGLFRRKEAA